MKPGFACVLGGATYLLATAPAHADLPQPTAVVGVAALGTEQFGFGLGASRDFGRWLRADFAVGGWAVGNDTGDWQLGAVGLRLLSNAPHSVPSSRVSLFLDGGLAHFYDHRGTDGLGGFRETTALSGGLELDYTYLGSSSSGFTLRLTTLAVQTLHQAGYDNYARAFTMPYRRSALASLGAGYSF